MIHLKIEFINSFEKSDLIFNCVRNWKLNDFNHQSPSIFYLETLSISYNLKSCFESCVYRFIDI